MPFNPEQAAQLLQALLNLMPDPVVVVLVMDQAQENVLDVRFESVSNVAALMQLHGKTIPSTQEE